MAHNSISLNFLFFAKKYRPPAAPIAPPIKACFNAELLCVLPGPLPERNLKTRIRHAVQDLGYFDTPFFVIENFLTQKRVAVDERCWILLPVPRAWNRLLEDGAEGGSRQAEQVWIRHPLGTGILEDSFLTKKIYKFYINWKFIKILISCIYAFRKSHIFYRKYMHVMDFENCIISREITKFRF